MVQINGLKSDNTFVPKQALAPTPQLYDELVGDGMKELAKATVAEIGRIEKRSVILDVGCGTGAGTAAVAEAVSTDVLLTLSIKGVDLSKAALDIYRQKVLEQGLPAQAILADAGNLTAALKEASFSHVIGTALLFFLPEDGIPAIEEMRRTLRPGGIAALNTWAYVPNMGPIRIASQETRPSGTPEIRAGMNKWPDLEFLKSTIQKAGFPSNKITVIQRNVYCCAAEFDHYANTLWSFIGGTTSVGCLHPDEEHWEQAIKIVKHELIKTDGFELLEDERVRLRFIANIAVVTR
ncbi:hypothetical protein E8E12_002892 [Didymella heteroderae]|uniref:Methyltransferase domain-containing protein n=1 Tax=Didymella heteroderae TaxID=1769908 RepID=A0A9P4WHK2_9PLEO|nr:hypothetical protein E8E12_002892 [Didymella heteroderae]